MSKTCFLKATKLLTSKPFNLAKPCYIGTSNRWWNPKTEGVSKDISNKTTNPNVLNREDSQEDMQEVLDIYKERLKYAPLLEEQEIEDTFAGLNLTRGVTGVFDIEDLIETLRQQNAEDIFVSSVPKEIKYVDYMVVISGRSQRHMQAIAQFVRKVYKQKQDVRDIVPKLEGADSADWMALDLGNIALHIFSRKARLIYDLDSLWAVGSKYDEEYHKKESVSSMLEKHSFTLEGLEPAT